MATLFYIEPNTNIFQGVDSSLDGYNQQELMSSADNENQLVDCMLNNPPPLLPPSSNFCCSNSFNKLSFADEMQFANFGTMLALNEAKSCEDEVMEGAAKSEETTMVQLQFLGENLEKRPATQAKNKRKRPRATKTSEEVESQRMTHIAVERNRRKQMNEHLRILRSLMPNSYAQRGDQASIIGGAIEFVRELEELLQCLESQKMLRLYGDGQAPVEDPSLTVQQLQVPLIFPTTPIPNDQVKMVEYETGLQEETAENKSCLADVEVKLIGFDGLIKILSRRRPSQLIKTIAALENLQLHILHTNVTTIDQTVLYSFNVKIIGEARFTAKDIADSIQQILSFIDANSSMS